MISSLEKVFLCLTILCCFGYNANAQTAPTTEVQYLSGTGKDDMVNWDFKCSSGMNSGEWTTIGVPSCWELQGFGHYNYGHDPLEDRVNEFGLYRYKFSVPDNWKNKSIKIVFEGVMTDAEVKINGELAGEIHQGAFYEFKYTITDLINFNEPNLLEVKVNKASSNESINHAERKADFWVFGGIFRPVYLQAFPESHIERIAIDAQADGDILAEIHLINQKGTSIELSLLDLAGDLVQKLEVTDLSKTENIWTLSSKALNIKTWNPELPNLYQLQVLLKDKRGHPVHQISQRIGFRTVQVLASDGIYINGQRIKFKGVNRHSFYPTSGRTTSKDLSIYHVKMMKDMNMNAVRMSHYPPDVHFLDVCDSLGLFVIDEVCTWHSPHLDTQVGRKIVMETVVRDVNHPSILLWANGNETGWNTELDDDYSQLDIQNREVIHPWNIFRKTNTLHYFSYRGLANDGPSKDKVFFPTEFLHGLYDGGHGAGLEDYWKLMWEMPLSAGGFLWDFADEAVVRTDKEGALDTDGNHAADGIVGPYGEKEGSYYTIKEVWSPIHIEERYIRNDFNGLFRVENRYHFTNLNQCQIKATWLRFNGPYDTEKASIISQSDIALPDLAPSQSGSFKVPLADNWETMDALLLKATDLSGKEIFTWSYPIRTPCELIEEHIQHTTDGEITSAIGNGQIKIKTKNHQYAFNEKNGTLEEVIANGELTPFNNGPIILGHQDKIEKINVVQNENNVEIVIVYEKTNKSPHWASHKEYSSDIIKWTIHPDGLLDLDVEIKGKRIISEFKGISFSFPESEVNSMKWLGNGPYRVWRNRMKGTKFQVWENEYNNTITGEPNPIYPEFKGYFADIYWAQIKGKNNRGFTVYSKTPDLFLRLLTPVSPKEDPRERVTPVFPEGDISFLKNISAIGTKFQEPSSMGPHGHTENYFGNSDDPISINLTFEF
ncbi:MAG: beta-galactosidase [Cyclobacteriaceae bacterium]